MTGTDIDANSITAIGRATILIVDDEAQNRKLLAALLSPEGYLTQDAASGEDALLAIARQAPDLILLDVLMPGMTGYQVASLLKANPATSTIPIIMVTAQYDRSARLAGLNAGAEEFLTRPVDRAELWLRVRNLLRLKAFGDFLRNHSLILEKQVLARTLDLQRFRTAMDATADAIFLTNLTTMRFIEVNATACNLLGYTRAEFFDMGPADLAWKSIERLQDASRASAAQHESAEVVAIEVLRKDGSALQVELHRHIHVAGSESILVGVMHNVTERVEAEKRLHRLAHYDALTGLPNRTLFYEMLNKTLIQATNSGWLVAVLFIDLDHFKDVNDTLGHAIGDGLLTQCSDRLVHCARIRDTVGRLGGDEFAMILVMQDDRQGAWLVAKKVRDAMRIPFNLKGHEVSVTVSIGITIHPDDAGDCETLLKYADTAMYRAKQAGRDTFRFFTAQMNTDVLARFDMEAALRKAIENEEFVLYYQPKVRIAGGHIVGLEALLRWQRPGHGLVPPKDFIAMLEETGLILRVGTWVIGRACRQIASWLQGPVGPMQISVNVSGRQFIEGDLDGIVIKALQDNDIPANLLELELTESSLMANTERTIASLQNLRSLGVQISIDDFGTGYSSLAYLRRFPIDKLKIDIAFIRDITTNPDDAAIALAIISMARSLKLGVIAEGVETAAQLTYLRRHHCDQIQGYYFSPPVCLADLERMLVEKRCLQESDSAPYTETHGILLVDADASALDTLRALLRQDGHQVLGAYSASTALELLALHEVEIIVCVPQLRDMGGIALFDLVRHLHPRALRIMLSDYSDLELLMDAINNGAIHRIYRQPWDGATLRRHIREALLHQAKSQEIFKHGAKETVATLNALLQAGHVYDPEPDGIVELG